MQTFTFPKRVLTDCAGQQVLCDSYHSAKQYHDCWFKIDWEILEYMEANLSAVLLALVHRLKQENNLKFYLDFSHLQGGKNVFWRNGLGHYICNKVEKPTDQRESTIPVRAFNIKDVDSFSSYIERDLLRHRGVESVRFHDKEKVKNSYFEIFSNVDLHANTSYPVLSCGQFFPQQKELKFSMIDLGDGFLKGIAGFTKDLPNPITNGADAIRWAVNGNSTKKDAAGGTGLKKIMMYCHKSNSALHIISDGCYWAYDHGKIETNNLKNNFAGTIIHLIFRGT